ncbi:hypothetical protein [Streptomyces sp. NPDC051286]|uniref:hypothetical protein n=1 Tax=Streptomyces sp. NPDC051286 TaxID=3365647 RepID=UPI0037A16FE8
MAASLTPYGSDPPAASPLRKNRGAVDGIAIAASSTAATTSIGIGLGVTAGAARFRGALRESWTEALRAVVIPVLSAVALLGLGGYLCWTFYTSADHFEISPDNGWLMLLTGVGAAAWAKWVRKSPYFTTGRSLAATEPAVIEMA